MADSNESFFSGLKSGDPDTFQAFWNSYYEKVCRLAKKRMLNLDHAVRDEEDIAMSAMKSFWLAVRKKEEKISGQDELWQLLVTITKRKVIREAEKQNAQKRDVKITVREGSHFQKCSPDKKHPRSFDTTLPSREPLPELILEGVETLDRIAALPDVGKIAELKLQGHSNTEISVLLGCSTRTVERKIERIMKIWQEWEENMNCQWKKCVQET